MYWKKYKREKVAQQLLQISHKLSDEAFVLRPIDDCLVDRFLRDIETIGSELGELGYPQDCTTLELISSVLSTHRSLESPQKGEGVRLSFMKALDLAQILIRAAQSLSTSSSPFPVPNRHPPPEILHLIYNYVAEQENHDERQKTVTALAVTSINWHQIVVERPIVYLPSLQAFEEYEAQRLLFSRCQRSKAWEELHVDLTEEENWIPEGESLESMGLCYWDDLLGELNSNRWSKSGGKLVVTLVVDGRNLRGGETARELGHHWRHISFEILELGRDDYRGLWMVLLAGKMDKRNQREYYIGFRGRPTLLDISVAQGFIDSRTKELDVDDWEYDIDNPNPTIFTEYTIFAAPWIVFTAPIFLIQTAQVYRKETGSFKPHDPGPIPPSRLRHLELSF
ncbi:hypothetical protein JCM3765_005472 [Sporobolomyces pararoseus]